MAANFASGFWEIIKEVAGWCSFVKVIYPWNAGIQIRLGSYVRTVGGGWWMHYPFGIDEFVIMNIKPKALELEEQALTTLDGLDIVVKGVVLWSVFDIKKALIDVDDAEDTLDDIVLGIIQETVDFQDWDYLRTEECRKEIKRAIQKQARKWGVSVTSFKWQSIVLARSFKVFGTAL